MAHQPDDLDAAMDALPWQQREHIFEMLSQGRGVEDPRIAALAARWAARAQRRASRAFGLTLTFCVVTAAAVITIVGLRDDDFDTVAAAVGTLVAVTAVGLIMWAQTRSMRRSEMANLALADSSAPGPPSKDRSHWVYAWLVSWPIAGVVVVVLQAVGPDALAGPAGLGTWIVVLWWTKRTIDKIQDAAPASKVS